MNLTPDITFFIQLGVFLVTLYLLNGLLIGPVLRVFDKRKLATQGVRQEITELRAQTEERLRACEAKIERARLEGIELKEKARRAGEEEALKLLSVAKKKSEEFLRGMEEQIAEERVSARAQLQKNVEEIGKKIADQVLA